MLVQVEVHGNLLLLINWQTATLRNWVFVVVFFILAENHILYFIIMEYGIVLKRFPMLFIK